MNTPHIQQLPCVTRLFKTFPDQLKQCKLSNKQGIIIYNNTLSEDTANRRAMFDHTLIVEAAFYLRGLIKNVVKRHEDLPENLNSDMLSNGQGDPPEELLTFFKVLYTGSLKAATNDKVSRLIESVCADVMFASSRWRFKPGKHLNMGLGIKSMTGSRKVLEILNRFGLSISYHIVEEIETSLANDISTKQFSTPDGLLRQSGLATALAWDNYDVNTETLSGGGTVHDTVGIRYQNIVPAIIPKQREAIKYQQRFSPTETKEKTNKSFRRRTESVRTIQKEVKNIQL